MRSFQPQRLQKPDKQNMFALFSKWLLQLFFLVLFREERKFSDIECDCHWKISTETLFIEIVFLTFDSSSKCFSFESRCCFEPLERSRRGLVPTTKRLSRLFRVVSMSRTEDPLLSKKKKWEKNWKLNSHFFFYFSCRSSVFFTRKLNCTIFLEALSCSKFEFITFSEQTILF